MNSFLSARPLGVSHFILMQGIGKLDKCRASAHELAAAIHPSRGEHTNVGPGTRALGIRWAGHAARPPQFSTAENVENAA
jgi:hypothetical protein